MFPDMSEKTVCLIRRSIVNGSLAVASFLLVLLLRQDFSFRGYSDAFFVAGAVSLGVTALLFIASRGTFDVLSYGMGRFLKLWANKVEDPFPDAGSYHQFKMEERKRKRVPLWPFLAFAGLLLALAALFLALSLSGK